MSPKAAKKDIDMTRGSPFRHLLVFALPLLAGNLFQQMYNTVDTWVVGNYVSNQAYSAVGSVTPIVTILIGAFSGLASGAGVIVSQYYGARRFDDLKRAVHTSILLTLILSITFSLIGVAMTPAMLRLMKTPADVFPEAEAYLRIYFAGMAGLLFYNMGAGILRAVGDSRRPFYFLLTTVVANIALDLIFVLCFHMGVEGVAYATIIAQAISALLVLLTLFRTRSCVRLSMRDMHLHLDMLRTIVRISVPAALQMVINSFSNIFVQSYINEFGTACMGGWTTYHKVDQLIFLPMQSLGLACSTFVGQNLGAEQDERAQKGVRTCLFMSMTVTAVVAAAVILSAPYLVIFFNDDPDVAYYGTLLLRTLPFFHVFSCANTIYSNALRGAGNTKAPMVAMLLCFVVFRQIYLYVVSNFISQEFIPVILAFPLGWILCSVSIGIYYKRTSLTRNRLIRSK